MICLGIGGLIGFSCGMAGSAFLFMIACSLCGVKAPEFGQSYYIMYCTWFLNSVVWGGFVFMLTAIFAPQNDPAKTAAIYYAFALFIAPANMLTWAWMVHLMVPTTFYRAIVIWAMQFVVIVVLAILLVMSFLPMAQQPTGV